MGHLSLKHLTSFPSWAQALRTWRPFRAPISDAEARERVVRLHYGWQQLRASAGWAVLVEEIDEEVRRVMGAIAAGNLNHAQYERLGARIETMVWLRELPAMRVASYDEILSQMREVKPRERLGPEGPVPWDDEDEDDLRPEG